jgi:predicted nucleic acid-binding protein
MPFLVDTNILLRSAQPSHPDCRKATKTVSKLLKSGDTVFFCAQNIAEFWNVATRPIHYNGLGMSRDEALAEVRAIEDLLTLLPDSAAIYPEWKRIVAAHEVSGVKVYDARLVAIVSVYGINSILTFNTRDFARYPHLAVIYPSEA